MKINFSKVWTLTPGNSLDSPDSPPIVHCANETLAERYHQPVDMTCRKHRQIYRYQQASSALAQVQSKLQASAMVMDSARVPYRSEPHAVRSASLWASAG